MAEQRTLLHPPSVIQASFFHGEKNKNDGHPRFDTPSSLKVAASSWEPERAAIAFNLMDV